jgi:hypothetical protein
VVLRVGGAWRTLTTEIRSMCACNEFPNMLNLTL